MPGHNGGRGAHPQIVDLLGEKAFTADITNVPGMDDLHQAQGVIAQAQRLAAELYGADQTFFLVNGASCGIQAMILAACQPGQPLILTRNCHRSVVSGLVLAGADPVFVDPVVDEEWGLTLGVEPAAVERARDATPGAAAVLLVNPSYFGVASNLAGIAALAHERDLPLLVDEAHGPHLPFHPALPPSALESGADACTQGTHKIAGGLTQSALLHTRGERVDRHRLAAALRLLQSTSASYLLLASLDAARLNMATRGIELLERTLELAAGARRRINQIPGLQCLDQERLRQFGDFALDATKVTVNVSGTGLTGGEIEGQLRQRYGVQVELSDLNHVLLLFGTGASRHDVDATVRALAEIAQSRRGDPPGTRTTPPRPPRTRTALSPRAAFFARQKPLPLEQCRDKISAEIIACYPPGIPAVYPGEVFTAELIDYLQMLVQSGLHLQGPADPTLTRVRVVDA